MRWNGLIVALVVAGCYSTSAPARQPPKAFKDLRLEIGQLRNQKSCKGGGGIYSEILDFDVRFVNTSNVNYDLFLNGDGPIETMVASTLEDLRMRKLVADWGAFIIPPPYDPDERTIQVAPSGASESKLAVYLYASSGPEHEAGTLAAGSYFVQVRIHVGVLKDPRAAVKPTLKPAKPKAVLIESSPVRVDVPAKPRLEECSRN
jgi:hypothetical protein